jgi:hypothetical protein
VIGRIILQKHHQCEHIIEIQVRTLVDQDETAPDTTIVCCWLVHLRYVIASKIHAGAGMLARDLSAGMVQRACKHQKHQMIQHANLNEYADVC